MARKKVSWKRMENISQIIQWPLTTSLIEIWQFFLEQRRILVALYTIFIATLILWIIYTKRVLRPIEFQANKKLDTLWYHSDILLYNNKSSIHNIQETLPLLLHYKKESIQNNNPWAIVEKLYEEYNYICKLVGSDILISSDDIIQHKHLIMKLQQTESYLKWLLALSTIGLSRIFF